MCTVNSFPVKFQFKIEITERYRLPDLEFRYLRILPPMTSVPSSAVRGADISFLLEDLGNHPVQGTFLEYDRARSCSHMVQTYARCAVPDLEEASRDMSLLMLSRPNSSLIASSYFADYLNYLIDHRRAPSGDRFKDIKRMIDVKSTVPLGSRGHEALRS